jgi:LPXTG-motif cell wall-anchored protein
MTTELAGALQAWVGTATATVSATSNGGTVTFTGLDFGYYVVTTSSNVAPIIVTTTNPQAVVYDKNYTTPSTDDGKPVKYLTNPEQDTYVKYGDTVGFTIKFVAKNKYTEEQEDGTKIEKAVTEYVITDTPQNLTIVENSLQVKVGDTVLIRDIDKGGTTHNAYSTDDIYGYKLTIDDNGVMTIKIQWQYKLRIGENAYTTKYADNAVVEITYNAKVNAPAADATEDEKEIKNSAQVSYGVKEGTLDGEVVLKASSFNLQKVDTYGNQLSGAVFQLQEPQNMAGQIQHNADGSVAYTPVTLAKVTDEYGNVSYHPYIISDLYSGAERVTEIEAGNVTINGLDVDTVYRLVETTAPKGFNLLEDPVIIEAVDKDEDGNSADKHFEDQTIINSTTTNVNLPQTGGIGTTIFYIVGGVLAVGALVLLITRKRVHLEHE